MFYINLPIYKFNHSNSKVMLLIPPTVTGFTQEAGTFSGSCQFGCNVWNRHAGVCSSLVSKDLPCRVCVEKIRRKLNPFFPHCCTIYSHNSHKSLILFMYSFFAFLQTIRINLPQSKNMNVFQCGRLFGGEKYPQVYFAFYAIKGPLTPQYTRCPKGQGGGVTSGSVLQHQLLWWGVRG